MNDPRRRWVLELKLGADDFPSLVRSLEHLAIELKQRPGLPDGGQSRDMCSGGPDAGYHAVISEEPGITNESYFADLERWMRERRRVG